MPQNVGTVSLDATLDFRKATAAYNRFQRTINQKGRRDNLFSGISEDAKQFESSLGKATNRVVAFAAAAALFRGLSTATSAFAQSIIEVDQSLAKINVNLGQSSAGLKKFGADLFNIARQTGQTFDVAASAAEELARQGLSAEETTKRLKDALILSRIAGLDSASAVETLTAAINSFNQEALTSTEVVNKFAAVDTKFAVSSKDLAEAVSRVGSTAQSAGVGINELIGLVTSLQQTTARGGATIGNGLKTIFTRIQAAPETVAALQSVGVAIKNTDGSLRDAISILRDYGAARERVGEVERASLDRTVAGTFQINILKAALADLGKQYSVYNNAVSTSANATDEAIRKNEQLNQTLASLINSTAVSIKQLFASIGDQSLGPAFKEIFQYIEQARAFFSGDSGDDLGRSLGEGILKGISNVLSGPTLVALIVILGQAFKKVVVTLASEAKTLLSINSIVGTRAAIQKQINNLLSQANTEEAAQIANARTLLAQKQALLAIQERLNQESLLGTALQNSFIVPGRLGVGSRIGKGLGKYPSFADPLASAVAREKAAGVPANQIYVDRDPRVANFANPQGLLVANRRDEPLGGYQGVNRVIAEGGNPKTAGTTPNFAPLKSQKDLVLERIGLKKTYEGAALTSVQIALANTKGVTEAARKLEKTIGSLDKAFEPLVQSAKVADAVRRALAGKTFGESPEEVRRAPTGRPYVIPRGTITAIPTNIPDVIPQSRRGFKGMMFESFEGSGDDLINRQVEYDTNNPQPLGLYNDSGAYPSAIGPSYKDFRRQQLVKQMQRRRNVAAAAARKRQAFGNTSLGLAFGLPLAAGFIEPGLNSAGISTAGGSSGGRFEGATSGALNGAGIGALTRNPYGIALGAVIGGLVGLFGKLRKSTEEINAELDEQIVKRSKESDAISRAIQIQEEINEATKSGADSSIIDKLTQSLKEARGDIQTDKGRAILGITDPKQQSKAANERQNELARQNAATEVHKLLGNKGLINEFSAENRTSGNEDLATAIKRALTDEAAKGVSDDQILALSKIAASNYNVNPVKLDNFDPRSPTINQNAISKAAEDFKEASTLLAPLAALADIKPEDISKETINAFALAIVRAVAGKRADIRDDAAAKRLREAAANRLPKDAFTSRPNLDVISQAALTGRNPRISQGQRAQTDFEFYQELINNKGISEEELKLDTGYRQAKAGTQKNNVFNSAIAFLKANNPDIGQLTNNLGDPNEESIKRLLGFSANSGSRNSSKAALYLKLTQQAQKTAGDEGIKNLSYGPNFSPSDSGMAPGGKYSVTAGDALKAAQETVQKTLSAVNATVIKSALSVDGTVRILSSDTLSSDALNKIAAELTASIGKQFQAQITDLNVRLSKAEGKPTPPTPVNTDSVFGNSLTRGSDGFIRSKPYAAPDGRDD